MGKQTITLGSVTVTGSEEALQGLLMAAKISILRAKGGGTYRQNLTGFDLFAEHNQVTGLDGFRYYTNRDKKNPGRLLVTRRRLPAKKEPGVQYPEEYNPEG